MYDEKSSPKEFVAATPKEAIAEATSFFGCDEPDLVVKEYSVTEVSGLGSNTMVIAVPKAAAAAAASRPERKSEERDKRRAPREPREARGEREPRSERRPRRDREVKRESKPRETEESEVKAPDEEAKEVRAPRERVRRESGARSVSSDLGKFVEGLVARMEIGDFSIEEGDDGDLNVVSIQGEAADVLTSGDGRVVDAIQFLVNQASLRGGDEVRKVVLEVEGDPDRREAYLTKLADRAARRAEDAARAMALDPMNPKDRRVVHVALRDFEGIATMSVGSGRYRRVVVVPEGAPEYEEAMKSNRNTSGNS